MWPEPTESKDSPPESWSKLLDCVQNNTMYQEALQSASNIALLIKDPVHRRAFAWARAEEPCPRGRVNDHGHSRPFNSLPK